MSNPTFSRASAEQLARSRGCQDQVMLVSFRSASSKYGEYDDTLALLTPDSYTEWKGNTLPSKWAPDIACLQPGDYRYIQGLHGIHHFDDLPKTVSATLKAWLAQNVGKDHPPITIGDKQMILPYYAFRQHGPVTVLRNGSNKLECETDPAKFPFIDLHHGGWNGTSSAGCQTWFPDRWLEAREKTYAAMDQYGQIEIVYSLHQL